MKNIQLFLMLFAFSGMALLSGCGGDDNGEPSAADSRRALLTSKTWTVSSVTTPPSSATEGADWAPFTVSFTDSNMTTANHPAGAEVVWPSGAWSFGNDAATTIVRGDGITMTINSLTESSLVVQFNGDQEWSTDGRTASLGGQYTFNLQ
ncbi:MAG: hypothetical protein ACFCUU_04590 [Cyclobacteriaceae bacterium]